MEKLPKGQEDGERMIELRALSVGYRGRAVLENVSLAFLPGTVTALLGPNGCGKTTLVKTALGLLAPLSGEVLYDGTPRAALTPKQAARRAAYLPQSRNVPELDARRLVLHGRFPYLSFPRRYRQEDHDAVRRALAAAGAGDLADRPLPELSGGQRQKVYLAMALAQETPTVFLDEPTAWLDARCQLDSMRAARALADAGRAVVLVCHDLCLALRTADRAAVFAGGRMLLSDTPEAVYQSGALDKAFDVRVRRVSAGGGWRYFCE